MVLLLTAAPVFAGAQSYHRLAAADFGGNAPQYNGDIAYTNCHVDYTYEVIHKADNYDIRFYVQLTMDNDKSYIRLDQVNSREQQQQILRHEQGHYNIAYLLKCEAYTVLTHHRYTANYHNEIAYLFNQVQAKYQKLNSDYEASTNHMTNVLNQDKWNAWFSKQLDNVELASATKTPTPFRA